MNSSTSHDYHQQSNFGLSRFHSAPSSLLENLMDATETSVNKSSFESERLITKFMNSGGDSVNLSRFQEYEDKSPISYGNSQQSCSGLPPHYPRQTSAMDSPYELFTDHNTQVKTVNSSLIRQTSAMDSPYELFTDHNTQVKTVNSSLIRQSSSPAGLFAKLSAKNGYASTKDVGNYGGFNGSNGELSPSKTRLKSQLSFPSRIPSSLGMLSQNSEIESGSPNHGKVENRNGDTRFYNSGFQYGSWNDSSHFTEDFTGLKREQENERKLFSGTQSGELGNCVHILSHQLSLPKTSAEMAVENSVPCKIRAKRGCATHPRSIAERVRRTRISERMRKLQELVPNMDKQTNTADMLDLAVEYIKDLQMQFKTLSDNRANCKCSSVQNPVPNHIV